MLTKYSSRNRILFITYCFLLFLHTKGIINTHASTNFETTAYTHTDLETVYTLAFEQDSELKQQLHTLAADRQNLSQARSRLLPSLRVSGNVSHSNTNRDNSQLDQDGVSRTYGITLTQPLFHLSTWYQYQQAKAFHEGLDHQEKSILQSFIRKVVETYLAVLRAQDNLALAKSEEAALKRQLEQNQQRFSVGLVPITDVHEAQAIYDNAKVNVFSAQNQQSVSLENLFILTGQSDLQILPLAANFPVTLPKDSTEEKWQTLALANNPELGRLQQEQEQTHFAHKTNRNAYIPTADLTSQHFRTERSEGLQSGFDSPDQDTTSISIEVSMPLYLGGAINANRRQSRYQLMAAKDKVAEQRKQIKGNIHNLFSLVSTDIQRVAARALSIQSSESALEATTAGYQAGTRNMVDVLQVQQQLFAAKRDYANARYDYILNLLLLKEVAGQLSPKEIIRLNPWFQNDL